MNDDICTMLQRTNQIWCAEGVIDNKWDAVLVSYCCYAFQIEHVTVGVAEGLGIYYFVLGLIAASSASRSLTLIMVLLMP